MNAQTKLHPTSARPFRFTVDQFLALHDQGAFEGYAKSELIEGEIVVMNAQYRPHARVKTRLASALSTALESLGSTVEVLVEVSIKLSNGSLPEPDICLTSYTGESVVPAETVVLAIEVSDTTLADDLGRKLRVYAEAGIPEYWVIDLGGGRAIRMWEASGDGYARRDETDLGQRLESATIAGLVVVTER